MLALGTEHARLNKAREDMPLWRRLKDINSFAGRQLSRDLRLTGDSVANLKSTRRSLEEARGFLIGYRDQGRPPVPRSVDEILSLHLFRQCRTSRLR
jgi:hypothetical protein